MNIRRFRSLYAAGATYAEIGRECGVDWRTVKKYLAEDASSVPPAAPARVGTQPQVIAPFVEIVEAWLRVDIALKGTVIHERLVAENGFTGSYQRVKMHLADARPRVAAELAEADENPLRGLHRRFEVVPGAQAQVDWGDEGDVLAHVGIGCVYSFHMTLGLTPDTPVRSPATNPSSPHPSTRPRSSLNQSRWHRCCTAAAPTSPSRSAPSAPTSRSPASPASRGSRREQPDHRPDP